MFKADKGHLHHRLVAKGFSQKQAVLILYGISAIFGMFAVILCDSGIWKALSFLLIMIVAVALGYKNFSVERTGNEQYECTQCKYIYNPKFGNEKQEYQKEQSLMIYQRTGFAQFVVKERTCSRFMSKLKRIIILNCVKI